MNSLKKSIVIILAAGKATRLRPLSERIPKPLVKINGISLLKRIVKMFKETGFTDFLVLVGYKGALIVEELKSIENIDISFVYQTEQVGMADALLKCFDYLVSNNQQYLNYIVTASDVIFSRDAVNLLFSLHKNTNSDIALSLMESRDLDVAKAHGNIKPSIETRKESDTDPDQGIPIIDILEKPEETQIMSEYYSLPFYIFNEKIRRYLKNIGYSKRGEKELQEAIKYSIENKDIVRGIKIINEEITNVNLGAYHLTTMKDIISMNIRFLNEDSREKSVSLKNVITGNDCNLGNDLTLKNVVMFDDVKIGNNAKLEWCIIDDHCVIPNAFKVNNCFITRNNDGSLSTYPF